MSLLLQNINKIVGRESHLSAINLEFAPGSRNVILGRTLAGKTSLLRIMAGLDRPTSGRLLLNDQDVTGVSVRKRNVAMVYQQFVNYPSMNIFDNIASPLKLGGMAKAEIDRRVRETASMLRIEHLLDRLPAELSGGQQQRTAIARALVKRTDLLLMDEPLVNLDYKLREELRVELQAIFKEREAIVVYTTTEPAEALMLGGRVVVLDEGRVLQTGPTADVYHHPTTMKVAEVFSDPPINYMDGHVEKGSIHLIRNIHFSPSGHLNGLSPGDYKFGVRSNHLFLNRQDEGDAEIQARVELAEINGSETFIHISHDNTSLVVQDEGIHPRKIGAQISVFVNPNHLFVYNPAGQLVASPGKRV